MADGTYLGESHRMLTEGQEKHITANLGAIPNPTHASLVQFHFIDIIFNSLGGNGLYKDQRKSRQTRNTLT